MDENWKLIPGIENYEASSHGRIRHIVTKIPRKLHLSTSGYFYVGLSVITPPNTIKKVKNFAVARIIAKTFIGHSSLPLDHIDGNPTNNSISNLEYVTPRENTLRMYKRRGYSLHGIKQFPNGTWGARKSIEGKVIFLGVFNTKEQAQNAYLTGQKKSKSKIKHSFPTKILTPTTSKSYTKKMKTQEPSLPIPTPLWPQDWVSPSQKRSALRKSYKKKVSTFLKQHRRKDLKVEQFLAQQAPKISRQHIYAHISHNMSLTKESMPWAQELFQTDPLELMLKTGHCPPELAYFLGWEIWNDFKEFLAQRETK